MSAPTMSSSNTSSSNTELDVPGKTGDQNPAPTESVAAPPVTELPESVVTDNTAPEPKTEAPPKPRLTELEKLQKAIPGTSYKDLPTLLALQRRLQTLMAPPAAETPLADKEPSAGKEPSTNEEPSATKEPSTNEEPSATKEPSAPEQPSAGEQPAVDGKISADATTGRSDAAEPAAEIAAQQGETVAVAVPAPAPQAGKTQAGATNDADRQQQQALAVRLEQLISQHHEWQRKTVAELDAAVQTLAKHISEGQVSESQSLWDRSQSALRRVNADDQARLQEAFAPLRAELTKLLDWRKFASSEKKKELIDKMQALVDDDTAPPQKARLIRTLQDEWKTLGHSEDNDALWTQFSETARLAFEPCKQYFRERKELQAANLVARNNICEQLEVYVLSLQQNELEANLGEINRLEQQARDDWKKYAPVAQNKIKALQKRFNAVLGQLRQFKRAAIQKHNAAKSALIDQAKALLTQDDLADAIRQSKDLQQQWKALGPGSFKDDRKLWTEFRAACDALFARRDERRPERSSSSAATGPAREVLKEIHDLLALDDEAFAESRPRFNQASKAFRNALPADLRGGERKALQDQFNKLGKRYDSRQRLTPDRKQLQLQQQVQQRAAVCQTIEDAWLKGEQVSLTAPELEANWTGLGSVDDSELEQTLQKRYKQVQRLLEGNADSRQQETRALAEKLASRAREICVDAEIMSGAETPAEDKAVRMQLQLNQLQKGLGRLPSGMREQLARLQQAELLLASTGPLEPVLRATLKTRLNAIRQRFQ